MHRRRSGRRYLPRKVNAFGLGRFTSYVFANRFYNAFGDQAGIKIMTTISKVAKRAGVSPTTVSHVLNHADRVSEHLRIRVKEAIDELGYVPNPQAQSLRTGRTNLIALLIPDIRNPFYPELVKKAQFDLEKIGLDTLIFNSDVPGGHPEEHTRTYLSQIKHRRVDGVIIGDFALHGMHDALHGLDIPTVFIGHLPNQAVDNVKVDDFGGGYAMGEYLAKAGHKRVANITGPSFFAEAVARAEGFKQGLEDNGVPSPADLTFEGTYLPPSGEAAVDWLVSSHKSQMPSAIFLANYPMAGAALAKFYDLGVRVPEDIAVTVFGDQTQLTYVRPELTRVGVSPSTLAGRACEMLIDRLSGSYTGAPRSETISCTLTKYASA